MSQITMMVSVVTHLELDILECEVKWALGSFTMNKGSGGNGIPIDYSNPKRWCCYSPVLNMPAKLSSGHRTGKDQSRRRAMPKSVITTVHLCTSHMLLRLCSKSFKLVISST